MPRKLRIWALGTSVFALAMGIFFILFAPAKHDPGLFRTFGIVEVLLSLIGMAVLRFLTMSL